MAIKGRKTRKRVKKGLINTETRQKLGLTQAQLAVILGVSRAYVSHLEAGRRWANSITNTSIVNMFFQFHELETGAQSTYRSLETRLFLNDEYKKIIPKMQAMEIDCRNKVKALNKDLAKMKEKARNAENAIIVLTGAINKAEESAKPGNKKEPHLKILHYVKEQAYNNLLICWEPEQATLHARIEAIAGQAKALRRYRTKVMREHDPFKKRKK